MMFRQTVNVLLAALMMIPGLLSAGEVGKPAPDFSLTGVDGKTYQLKDYKKTKKNPGKVVVLEWTNHGCPFVQKHYHPGHKNMQNLQQKYTDQGVIWLTINSSAIGKQGHHTVEEWQKLNQDNGSKATAVVLDSDGKVGKAYQAKVTPHMYVINTQGVVVYNGAIDNNDSAKVEDIAKSINYVSQALDQVLANQPVSTQVTKPYGCSVKYAD